MTGTSEQIIIIDRLHGSLSDGSLPASAAADAGRQRAASPATAKAMTAFFAVDIRDSLQGNPCARASEVYGGSESGRLPGTYAKNGGSLSMISSCGCLLPLPSRSHLIGAVREARRRT